jgi:hypothetical protein
MLEGAAAAGADGPPLEPPQPVHIETADREMVAAIHVLILVSSTAGTSISLGARGTRD